MQRYQVLGGIHRGKKKEKKKRILQFNISKNPLILFLGEK